MYRGISIVSRSPFLQALPVAFYLSFRRPRLTRQRGGLRSVPCAAASRVLLPAAGSVCLCVAPGRSGSGVAAFPAAGASGGSGITPFRRLRIYSVAGNVTVTAGAGGCACRQASPSSGLCPSGGDDRAPVSALSRAGKSAPSSGASSFNVVFAARLRHHRNVRGIFRPHRTFVSNSSCLYAILFFRSSSARSSS